MFFIFLFFFFFFKQKTAYEMLLCDWSSDVCSSDLSSPSITIGGHAKSYRWAASLPSDQADSTDQTDLTDSTDLTDLTDQPETDGIVSRIRHQGHCRQGTDGGCDRTDRAGLRHARSRERSEGGQCGTGWPAQLTGLARQPDSRSDGGWIERDRHRGLSDSRALLLSLPASGGWRRDDHRQP